VERQKRALRLGRSFGGAGIWPHRGQGSAPLSYMVSGEEGVASEAGTMASTGVLVNTIEIMH